MKYKAIVVVVGFAMLVSWRVSDAAVINTMQYWDGGAFAIGDEETVAQTFGGIGADNILTSVSFQAIDIRWEGDPGYGVPYTFQMSIYEWNNGPVGAPLYVGTQANPVYFQWSSLTFNTGAVSLNAGSQYAMLISVSSNPEDTEWTNGDVSYTSSNVYADGGFFYYTNGLWNGLNGDLAFTATLTSVPIPAPVWLFMSGLVSLTVFMRGKKTV